MGKSTVKIIIDASYIAKKATELSYNYVIISVANTASDDKYIKMWGPNCCGYRGRIETAGEYSPRTVNNALHYFNDGINTIAVPMHVVKHLAVPSDLHFFDEDGIGPGHWLKNDATTWLALLCSVAAINKNIEKLHFDLSGK